MRLDGSGEYKRLDGECFNMLSERYLEPCYVYIPQWKREEEYIRWRRERGRENLYSILESEPEMELVARCLLALGQDSAGMEIYLWRRLLQGRLREEYCQAAAHIADCISGKENPEFLLKELYFALILPVTAAMDADEPEIAAKICRCRLKELEKQYARTDS